MAVIVRYIIGAGLRMKHDEFDLFEIFPDGSAIWRHTVTGRDEAFQRLREFSLQTANEVRLMHLPTNTVIATIHTPADTNGTESQAEQT
jgi:hypothetical protein